MLAIYTSRANRTIKLEEEAREAYESDDYCAALSSLKRLSRLDSGMKILLGNIYASGLCEKQDIARARDLFSAASGGDQRQVGERFFYSAIELAESNARKGRPNDPKILESLFAEAKAAHYEPTLNAKHALTRLNLPDWGADAR